MCHVSDLRLLLVLSVIGFPILFAYTSARQVRLGFLIKERYLIISREQQVLTGFRSMTSMVIDAQVCHYDTPLLFSVPLN
jgi:hypothetical protein